MRKRVKEAFVPASGFYQSGDPFYDRLIILMQVAGAFGDIADLRAKCAAEIAGMLFPEPPKEA